MDTTQLTSPILAIVLPCFNEELIIEDTTTRLLDILQSLIEKGKIDKRSFIYYVDDGSTDDTWSLINELHNLHNNVKGLKLSRNFGHQSALLAGLLTVKGRVDGAISIDADLQDDVSVIEQFVEKFQEGYDIVYGIKRERAPDPFLKKLTAKAFYKLMRTMGVTILDNHADCRFTSRKALDILENFGERNIFLRGIYPLIGLKTTTVTYDINPRMAGLSKYSLRKMLSLAIHGITSFSIVPLRLVAVIGFLLFLFSCAMGGYVLWAAIAIGDTVPGWASTVLPIYLLSGIQLMAVGVLGEYIGKLYQEVKARPRYIVDSEVF